MRFYGTGCVNSGCCPVCAPLREQRAAVTVCRGSEVRGHVVAEKRNAHGMAGVAHPDCAGGANAVIRVGEHRLCTESDVRQVDARAGELAAKPAALQTGLRHISNRSRACRNGNWKMPSRDWRRKATGRSCYEGPIPGYLSFARYLPARFIIGDRLDILVANAGISKAATIEEMTVQDFDKLFAVNVRAPYFLVQLLLPWMPRARRFACVRSSSRDILKNIHRNSKGLMNYYNSSQIHFPRKLEPV
jgi:NAD(P)-dependent dehydrogenase (short-subunit alcohol dehydrogenase family)